MQQHCDNNKKESENEQKSMNSTRADKRITDTFKLSIGILGSGLIGKEFVLQLCDQTDVLEKKCEIVFIADSRKEIRFKEPFRPSEHARELLETMFDGTNDLAIWAKNLYEGLGLELDIVKCATKKERQSIVLQDLEEFKNKSAAYCLIDLTASEEVADMYHVFLALGIHVVSANKKVNSGDSARDQKCRGLSSSSWSTAHWLYEATIGAGLPIISTIRNFSASGDEIFEIKGVLSGTMSYLFNTYDGTKPFSEVVKQAKDLGFTEPDAREDLNGKDVARKVVIAAREAGWLDATIEKTMIESLVPESLRSCKKEEFEEKFASEVDEQILQRFTEAKERGNVLRFCGSANLKTKELKVELMEFPKAHAFASLSGSQNVIEIESSRYNARVSSTLTISGPGAGSRVTAGGVLSDVAKLIARLGDVEVLI